MYWRDGLGIRYKDGVSALPSLLQKSQVSAVTFDLRMHTFASGLQFVAFFQGSWVETGFQSGKGLPHKEVTVQDMLGDQLDGSKWVGIQRKVSTPSMRSVLYWCTHCGVS